VWYILYGKARIDQGLLRTDNAPAFHIDYIADTTRVSSTKHAAWSAGRCFDFSESPIFHPTVEISSSAMAPE
jgi:hypothetical protein